MYFKRFDTGTRRYTGPVSISHYILCFKNKKSLVACLGTILIVIAMPPLKNRFIHVNPITSLRLDINRTTFEIIKDFAIIGIGFGIETYKNAKYINLKEYNKRVLEKYRQSSAFNDPHSISLSIAVRTGLLGLSKPYHF